jgi:hypothetical protein
MWPSDTIRLPHKPHTEGITWGVYMISAGSWKELVWELDRGVRIMGGAEPPRECMAGWLAGGGGEGA